MGDQFQFRDLETRVDWARVLEAMSQSSVYSSWGWGEYKQRQGWAVRRLAIHHQAQDAPVGCAQIQSRRLGPFRAVVIQGGIPTRSLGDDGITELVVAMRDQGVRLGLTDVLIISPVPRLRLSAETALLRSGGSPVINGAAFTYLIDMAPPIDDLERALSSNWRHNLHRGRRSGVTVTWVTEATARRRSLDVLRTMYAAMVQRKGFRAAIDLSDRLDWVADDPNFQIVEATLAGDPIAVRVVYLSDDHVMDFLAAASEVARNTYANYLLMWSVIERAHALQKQFVDCGGIDPRANLGVFNFKRGLGGQVAAQMRWVYARNPLLRQSVRWQMSGAR